jgi:hypothetical protein
MTKRDVVRLSCKVLSIYTLIAFLASLAFPLSMLQPVMWHPGNTLVWLLSLIPTILLLLLSAYLWFGADALSARIVPGPECSESTSGLTAVVIQRIAFSLVGILVLVGAMSPLRQVIDQIGIRIARIGPRSTDLWLAMLAIEVVIRLALGAWLLLGSENVRRLLQKAKPLVEKDW